ncbi:MAG: hypothetical protein SFU56_14180 [Capsulimonadales bacterium]|nr:hypothetical protein [Capsulimonadales bacterium]
MKRKLLSAFSSICLLGFSAFASPVRADDPPASGENATRITYRQLTWDDFRVDDRTPGMSAQSHIYTSFGFKSRVEGRNDSYVATVTELTFNGGFDRQRSWRRSSVGARSELLLDHEQGHFDLAELKLRQLRRWKPEEMPTGAGRSPEEAYRDLKKKLQTRYHDEIKDLERTQRRYDEETKHGVRRDIQNQWRERIDRALKELPQVTPTAPAAGRVR